jgi:hypothetical protein
MKLQTLTRVAGIALVATLAMPVCGAGPDVKNYRDRVPHLQSCGSRHVERRVQLRLGE